MRQQVQRQSQKVLALSLSAVALVSLIMVASSAHGNEVPSPVFSFDQGGGTILPDPLVTSVQVNFDPSASLPLTATAGRFYRAIWEYNADCNGVRANPFVNVTGCGATTVLTLGGTPEQVVGPGTNGELETEPAPTDLLSNAPGQLPEIHTGPDLTAETRVAQNIVVKAGTDGILRSAANGDDILGVDLDPNSTTFGQPIILAGDNNIAESYAFPGICVRSGPNGVLATAPGGDDLLAPGGDPETGRDVIIDGGNMICETTVAGGSLDIQFVGPGVFVSDDPQVAAVGANVAITNVVIDPGPNGVLDTAPFGDDRPAVDVRGRNVITVGANRFANTTALLDDVQVLQIGEFVPNVVQPFVAMMVTAVTFVVVPGPDGALITPPAGDDILTVDSLGRQVIVVGDNLLADTTALPGDVQVLPPGSPVPNYLVPPDAPNYNFGYRFTDDLQVRAPENGLTALINPGTDTGYTTLAAAKAPQCVIYTYPTIQPLNEVDEIICVRLRIQVAEDENGKGMVESVFERLIHLSLPNFPPRVNVDLSDSQLDTIQPGVNVSVKLENTYDQDGFPLWGAIDWGDGNFTILTEAQLAQMPTLLGDLSHPAGGYAQSGIYKITISIIDNGRLTLPQRATFLASGQKTATEPAPGTKSDAEDVLGDANCFQTDEFLAGNAPTFAVLAPNYYVPNSVPAKTCGLVDILGNRIDPILNQDSIFIRVLGGFAARGGRLRTALSIGGRDALALKVDSSTGFSRTRYTFLPGDVVTVSISNPTSGTSFTLGSGALKRNGSFKDLGTGLRFKFNRKSGLITFKLRNADLKNFFEYYLATGSTTTSTTPVVQNGWCEAIVTITGLTGGTPIGPIRFVYDSTRTKGKGKRPISIGNSG